MRMLERSDGRSYSKTMRTKACQRANGAKDIPRTHERRLNEFEDERQEEAS